MTKKSRSLDRRDVLRILGVAGASSAVGYFLSEGPLSPFQTGEGGPAHGEGTEGHRWGMAIDLGKCVGCHYCVRACQATNDWPQGMAWNLVVEEKTKRGKKFHFNRPCLHCEEPPCAEVCPVTATYKREDGLVVMDYEKCIGCRYCMVACPYEARSFNFETNTAENPSVPKWGNPEVPRRPRGVVEKCTFCVHRIDNGLKRGLTPGVDRPATPACVDMCPVGARVFGDLNDPTSPVSRVVADKPTFRLREELGTGPKVYYVPPREGDRTEVFSRAEGKTGEPQEGGPLA